MSDHHAIQGLIGEFGRSIGLPMTYGFFRTIE